MINDRFAHSTKATRAERKIVPVLLMLCLLNVPLLDGALYANGSSGRLHQADVPYAYYSPQQLDNLLAPIALYPDPLLAQVLPAATFPDQIDDAARYVRASGTDGIDYQNWDVSVKAVAHYPAVLYMMADRLDWTAALGQAYVYQSTDVMGAVQRLRAMAHAQGNLISSPQQEVIIRGGYIAIVPAHPRYVYVPVYDPSIIYFRRAHAGPVIGGFISFGAGFVIGAWLNRDCDWHGHRVYYHGWHGAGWIGRSRPVVHVTNVYVNNSYTNINVNRTVINRKVNYTNINNYNSVHRDVTFDHRAAAKAPGDAPNKNAYRNANTHASQPARPRASDNVARPASGKPGQQGMRTGAQPPSRSIPPAAAQQESRSVPPSVGKRGASTDRRASGPQGQAGRTEARRGRASAPGQSKDSKAESKRKERSPSKH